MTSVVAERSRPPKQGRPRSCSRSTGAAQASQAARSIQRSACSVHSLRCMRRKAFWAPGSAIAFSALRARSSALTESPKLGLALRHTSGIGPVVVLVGGGDEGEPAVVLQDAFQHLDRVVVVLEADRVAVVAGGGDLEQQRLAAGAGRGLEHIDHVAGLVRVQLVDDRAMHVQAVHGAGIGGQRHEARGAGLDVQVVDQHARPGAGARASSGPCAWPRRTRSAPGRGWSRRSRPRRPARRRRPAGRARCRPRACSCRSSSAPRSRRCGSAGGHRSAASRTGSRPRTPARERARRSARPTRPWSDAGSRRSRSRGAAAAGSKRSPRAAAVARSSRWRSQARRTRRLVRTCPSATARA